MFLSSTEVYRKHKPLLKTENIPHWKDTIQKGLCRENQHYWSLSTNKIHTNSDLVSKSYYKVYRKQQSVESNELLISNELKGMQYKMFLYLIDLSYSVVTEEDHWWIRSENRRQIPRTSNIRQRNILSLQFVKDILNATVCMCIGC